MGKNSLTVEFCGSTNGLYDNVCGVIGISAIRPHVLPAKAGIIRFYVILGACDTVYIRADKGAIYSFGILLSKVYKCANVDTITPQPLRAKAKRPCLPD